MALQYFSRVLVTGANGFIGRAVSQQLMRRRCHVTALVRRAMASATDGEGLYRQVVARGFGPDIDYSESLQGVDTVIHLAARVHVMRDVATDPLAEFRRVNVAGTEAFARAAAALGVKRFIFLSSIKVNGEQTVDTPFQEQDAPMLQDPYAISKWEAEQVLWKVARETGMEVVVLRPPLVYGAGVKANFLRLLQWIDIGIPLPFQAVRNRRSMIYLGNLVDALMLVAVHPKASGRTWLVSDGEDVSSPELIRRIASAMGKPERLFHLPLCLLRLLGRVTGKAAEVERMLGSLQIDSSSIRNELDWVPPYTMTQGLAETVKWYREFAGRADA